MRAHTYTLAPDQLWTTFAATVCLGSSLRREDKGAKTWKEKNPNPCEGDGYYVTGTYTGNVQLTQ